MFKYYKTPLVAAGISGYSLHVGISETDLKRVALESEVTRQKTQVLPSKEVADRLWSFVKYYRSLGRSSYLVRHSTLYSVTLTILLKLAIFYPSLCFKVFSMKSGQFGLPPPID